MAEEIVSEDRTLATYAQPLSRLQVSWGAILAGALAIVAVSTIIWGLCLAVILSATNATVASLRGSLIAAWICSIITTLIGAFVGGAIAGYLPGNPRRSITIAHGFLAWALAFFVSVAMQVWIIGGVTRTVTSAAVTTTSAAVQSAGAAVGGAASSQTGLDQRAISVLESLGYSPQEATSMVQSARGDLQRILRGQTGQAQAAQAGAEVRGALDTLLNWVAGYTWFWWGTWFVAGGLAMLGAAMMLPRVKRVPERELASGRAPLHVATMRHVHGTP